MEKIEHKNLKNLSQFITSHQFLIKITQLLLSVSLFSLLILNSSRLSFLCSFKFFFSDVSVQLFNYHINKNCLFLLCNGLLVFVSKFSGLITSSSEYNNHNNKVDQYVKNYYQDYYASKLPLMEEKEEIIVQENVVCLEERKENEVIKEKEEENYEDQEDNKVFEDKFIVQEKYQEYYEDEDEEENGNLSTEELNKKFEEFIRKMKEEIRFEEKQQLVMVN